MYRDHTVGVVIPAYNEEPFVRETIVTVPAFVDRIYVVDDASTDDTWTEIQRAVEADRRADSEASRARRSDEFDERVVAIQHEQNRGVGGAIKTGYRRARDDGIAATAVMGGDGQMDPDVLGTLFDPIVDGEADYVKGNRLAGRRDHGDMPGFRFVGNAVLGALTKVASGYWSTGDPQTGYTAISLRALREADIDEMYEFYGYCNDLLVKLNVARLRVVDLPIPIVYGDEESHIKYHTYIPRVSWMLLRNFLWRLRVNYVAYDFHPLVVAYAVGAGAVGLAGAGLLATATGVGGATPAVGTLLSATLFLLGTLSMLAAMVMDMRENEHLDEVLLPGRGTPTGEPTRSARAAYTRAPSSNGHRPRIDAEQVVESDGGRSTDPDPDPDAGNR